VKKVLSHPNSLTLFRVFAVPIIVILLLFPNRLFALIAALLFSAAAITDYLDGFFARRRGLVSNLGKIMDPLADKLLVSSAFIMLASHGWVPAWMVCIIIGRELAVTGLRNIIAQKGEDLSASNLGKYKTGFQICGHHSPADSLSLIRDKRSGSWLVIFMGCTGFYNLVRC
jgi:CDP-diacylglycerol---glycerol-3-phosphate 3-phosphatidyltransferase